MKLKKNLIDDSEEDHTHGRIHILMMMKMMMGMNITSELTAERWEEVRLVEDIPYSV